MLLIYVRMMVKALALVATVFAACVASAAEVVMKPVDYAPVVVRWQRQDGFVVCRSRCPESEELVESQGWRVFRMLGSVPAVSPGPVAQGPERPEPLPKEHRLYFCFDSASPPADGVRRLEEFVEPGAVYDVLGYASPEGPASYNLQLSHRRAAAAAEIVKSRGGHVRRVEGLGEILFDEKNPASSRVAVIKKVKEVSR